VSSGGAERHAGVNYQASQNAAVAGGTAYLCVPGTSC